MSIVVVGAGLSCERPREEARDEYVDEGDVDSFPLSGTEYQRRILISAGHHGALFGEVLERRDPCFARGLMCNEKAVQTVRFLVTMSWLEEIPEHAAVDVLLVDRGIIHSTDVGSLGWLFVRPATESVATSCGETNSFTGHSFYREPDPGSYTAETFDADEVNDGVTEVAGMLELEAVDPRLWACEPVAPLGPVDCGIPDGNGPVHGYDASALDAGC